MKNMKRWKNYRWAACGLLIGSWLGTGCSSAPDRLTPGNYALITQQMTTEPEVAALLGEPTNRLNGQWLYERPNQHLFVFIDFDQSGRVVRKQWVDARTGEWSDTRDQQLPGSTQNHSSIHSNK